MKLFTSFWGNNKTFKMMPVVEDCPYIEAIYDPNTMLLVVISKLKHEKLQMLERLDADGSPIKAKKPKLNNKPWQEERISMNILQEYYITEEAEQEEFIKEFGINAESFDYKRLMRDLDAESNALHVPEKMGIVDEKGVVLKKTIQN